MIESYFRNGNRWLFGSRGQDLTERALDFFCEAEKKPCRMVIVPLNKVSEAESNTSNVVVVGSAHLSGDEYIMVSDGYYCEGVVI